MFEKLSHSTHGGGGGGGGGLGCEPNFVDWMRIWVASFSPVLFGSHGVCGQAGVELVPQVRPAMGRPWKGGPLPVWLFTLDRMLM